MNIEQLEEILKGVKQIQGFINEDSAGSLSIKIILSELEVAVLEEMKSKVWLKYLEVAR